MFSCANCEDKETQKDTQVISKNQSNKFFNEWISSAKPAFSRKFSNNADILLSEQDIQQDKMKSKANFYPLGIHWIVKSVCVKINAGGMGLIVMSAKKEICFRSIQKHLYVWNIFLELVQTCLAKIVHAHNLFLVLALNVVHSTLQQWLVKIMNHPIKGKINTC